MSSLNTETRTCGLAGSLKVDFFLLFVLISGSVPFAESRHFTVFHWGCQNLRVDLDFDDTPRRMEYQRFEMPSVDPVRGAGDKLNLP